MVQDGEDVEFGSTSPVTSAITRSRRRSLSRSACVRNGGTGRSHPMVLTRMSRASSTSRSIARVRSDPRRVGSIPAAPSASQPPRPERPSVPITRAVTPPHVGRRPDVCAVPRQGRPASRPSGARASGAGLPIASAQAVDSDDGGGHGEENAARALRCSVQRRSLPKLFIQEFVRRPYSERGVHVLDADRGPQGPERCPSRGSERISSWR